MKFSGKNFNGLLHWSVVSTKRWLLYFIFKSGQAVSIAIYTNGSLGKTKLPLLLCMAVATSTGTVVAYCGVHLVGDVGPVMFLDEMMYTKIVRGTSSKKVVV